MPRPRVIVTRPAREAARWVERVARRGHRCRGAAADRHRAARRCGGAARGTAAPVRLRRADVRERRGRRAFLRAASGALRLPSRACASGPPGPAPRARCSEAGVPAAAIDAPPADAAQFDSEALWAQRAAAGAPGARVLIVRGGDARGRPRGATGWHARSPRPAARATTVVAYRRLAPSFERRRAAAGRRRCATAARSGCSAARRRSPICAARCPARDWHAARAIATHARIAEAARAAGFGTCARLAPVAGGAGRVDRILRMSDASVLNEPLQEPAARAPVPATLQRRALRRPRPLLSRIVLRPAGASSRVVALVIALALWQKVGGMQEQLARQSADALAQSMEARTLARQAQEVVRDTAARLALDRNPRRRSRAAALAARGADAEPVALARREPGGRHRVGRAPGAAAGAGHRQRAAACWPRSRPATCASRAPRSRGWRRCSARCSATPTACAAAPARDSAEALQKLDDLMRSVDDLPRAQCRRRCAARGSTRWQAEPVPADAPWWQRFLLMVRGEARSLLRVGRIERPEAVLLAPEQTFFLRENLKLKLLNARLALLSRQVDTARNELATVSASLNRYFDPASRRVAGRRHAGAAAAGAGQDQRAAAHRRNAGRAGHGRRRALGPTGHARRSLVPRPVRHRRRGGAVRRQQPGHDHRVLAAVAGRPVAQPRAAAAARRRSCCCTWRCAACRPCSRCRRQARQWRLQQKERALHAALLDALAQLLAGRFSRARKAAQAALAQERTLAALDAAPAAGAAGARAGAPAGRRERAGAAGPAGARCAPAAGAQRERRARRAAPAPKRAKACSCAPPAGRWTTATRRRRWRGSRNCRRARSGARWPCACA